MSRYIDADLCKAYATDYYPSVAYGVKKIIDEQPTADVRENVRGEWIYLGLDVAGEYMYQCSHCKAIIYEPEFLINYDKAQLLGTRFNYCPNCGADMRKEETE